jgi:drug/metabolite transporter (DMT)-like permease
VSSILIFVRPFIFPTRPGWHHLGALFIGVVGLIAFSWPDKQHDSNIGAETGHASHGQDG